METLLAHGAYPDSRNLTYETPLMIASREGHGDIVRLLLQKGTFVNARDDFQRGALSFAKKHEHLGLAKILLEHRRSFLGYTGDCD